MVVSSSSIDLHKYLRILSRRKWFLIAPVVSLTFLLFFMSLVLPKIYEAKAVIFVDDKKVVNPLLSNLAVSTPVGYRLQVIKEEIMSWPRLFQLVERLGLNKDIKEPLKLERLINEIRGNITFQMRQNGLILIGYLGEDARRTQEVVNTLCDILIQKNVASQLEDTGSAIDFINEQLKIYKAKLDKSAEELRKFTEIYGLHIAPGVSDTVKAAGQSASGAGTDTIRAPLGQLNDELAALESELVMASVELTDEHPRIKGLKRRIESLKSKRLEYIKQMSGQAGVNAEAYVTIADSIPRQQEELMRLTRDKAVDEKIYGMLLDRLESAKITERLDDSENRTKFQMIEPARLPLVPVKPNKVKFTLLGFMLGAAVGVGLIFLLEYIDSSIKTEEDLKEALGVPVIGNISRIMTKAELAKQPMFFERLLALIPERTKK